MSKLSHVAYLGFALALCLPAGGAGYYPPGDVYDGELVSEGSQGITINIQPCTSAKTLVSIHFYRKAPLSDGMCPGASGRKYKRVHIEETAPPATVKPDAKPVPDPDPKKDFKPGAKPDSKSALKPEAASTRSSSKAKPVASRPAIL